VTKPSSSGDQGVERDTVGYALEVDAVDKHFGGTHALREVSLQVRPGDVHAIVGENGAGKSTLVKIIAGVYPAGTYRGHLKVAGVPIKLSGIHAAEETGIFLVPQDLQVVPRMSVAENLFLNREGGRLGVVDYGTLWLEAARSLRSFGLEVDPSVPMSRLSTAQQQVVIIARAMTRGVRILALDEPTASLTESETDTLFRHLADLREHGITVLYISHRIDEITRVADRITVLRDGRVVKQLTTRNGGTTSGEIVRAMVGRDIGTLYRREHVEAGGVLLEVRDFTIPNVTRGRPPHVVDAALSVRAGEVVGLFGVIGSGTAEFVRALLGAWPGPTVGDVLVRGERVAIRSPADALRVGMGYLPGDRQRNGLFPQMSVCSNLSVLVLKSLSSGGVLRGGRELKLVQAYVQRLRVRARSLDQEVNTLSGGNQQKVITARVMAGEPEIIVLHEPTQGIDVGTKAEMYALMGSLAKEGRAILLVSSDLPEVIAVSDTVLAMRQGRIVGRWPATGAQQEQILAAATGGGADGPTTI